MNNYLQFRAANGHCFVLIEGIRAFKQVSSPIWHEIRIWFKECNEVFIAQFDTLQQAEEVASKLQEILKVLHTTQIMPSLRAN